MTGTNRYAETAFERELAQLRSVELKVETGRLSTAQVAFKEQAEALGFRYAECRSVDEVERFVRGLIAGDGADHHRQGGGDDARGEAE